MAILHVAPDPFACLYVIEINRGRDCGRIKVGFTAHPATRLAHHRELALAYGCTPGREYVSPPGSGSPEREIELIEWCAARPRITRYRREYFAGLDYTGAARKAAKLCCDYTSLLTA